MRDRLTVQFAGTFHVRPPRLASWLEATTLMHLSPRASSINNSLTDIPNAITVSRGICRTPDRKLQTHSLSDYTPPDSRPRITTPSPTVRLLCTTQHAIRRSTAHSQSASLQAKLSLALDPRVCVRPTHDPSRLILTPRGPGTRGVELRLAP